LFIRDSIPLEMCARVTADLKYKKAKLKTRLASIHTGTSACFNLGEATFYLCWFVLSVWNTTQGPDWSVTKTRRTKLYSQCQKIVWIKEQQGSLPTAYIYSGKAIAPKSESHWR